MSGYYGYGFYDEEDTGGITTGGLLTGGAARAKKPYDWDLARTSYIGVTRKGTHVRILRPVRKGFSVEGATKFLYNKQLQANNPWFKIVRQDAELADLRQKIAARMKALGEQYMAEKKKAIESISDEKARELARAKLTKQIEARERAKQMRAKRTELAQDIINKIKAEYPDPRAGLQYILTKVPNRRAAIIALKVIYGLSNEEINEIFPKKKSRYVYTYREGEQPKIVEPKGYVPAPVPTAAK